ncbi:D-alanyl-D-alanine carboxypeptidase family protein [Anaerovorax sp. IOR16]|uniref:D-alanyl-D-alanine carboxypeptidase family protein n=1 Tax=Anaerovorax sp. IOR16 TaxID=2773458 RepID=UPI0019D27025|nr:D-alanyl-D-alanine carboxypeptidase family protein [Anaerovorax sp. IOR16]
MKKFFAALLAVIFVCSATNFSYGAAAEPIIGGASGILIDATTGEILYQKDADVQRYPASTTKMITALLALENLDLNKVVTVDTDTPFTEGSRMYLIEGEQLKVEQILYGMMTESANDAAVALAKEVSGSVEEFAKLMNQRAKELGAKNTNFVTPNGLHDDAHVTTAYDLAMIAKYAMTNEKFRDLVTTYRFVLPQTNKQETRYMYNTNRMLYDEKTKVVVNGVLRGCKYEGVTGIKTGYTSHAGGCLVASAKRGDTELIAVTLASTDKGRFADCITLLDYGFANYKTVHSMESGTELGEIKVSRGSVNRVKVTLAKDAATTLPVEASPSVLSTKLVLDKSLKAPVKKGEKAGVLQVYEGDTLLKEYEAVAAVNVKKGGPLSIFGITDKTAKLIGIVALIIVGFLILLMGAYIALKRRQVRLRKQRRLERQKRIQREELERRTAWEEEYERRYQRRS